MADHCPLGRCATPEDVARVVGFLSSEDGGWVNGQVITISGRLSREIKPEATKTNKPLRRLFPVDQTTTGLTMCLLSITYDFWATAKETLYGADYRPLRSLRHSLRGMRWSGWEFDMRHIENYEMTHESGITSLVFSSWVDTVYVRLGPTGLSPNAIVTSLLHRSPKRSNCFDDDTNGRRHSTGKNDTI